MIPGEFMVNFEDVAHAPGGVSRLRELILQLAFTGDLTTRSGGDGHALEVLELNQQTKAAWSAKGMIRQQTPLNRLSEAEHPWRLPETWLWCRLGEITTYGATDKAEFSDSTPETWILELEDIEKDTSRLLGKVRAKDRRFQSSKNRFSSGDVLYGKLRPYLDKVVLADEDGVCTTEIIPITIFSGILPEYLRWFLKSPFFKAYATRSTHGMNLPRMGTDAGRNAVFPLAPLAEQKRIVAKVDELMALCDQLEAQQQERERRFPVLSRTCHARFAEAPTAANLNRIFDETGTISPNDLRKTILTLSVQGKLVRRLVSEGVGSEILKRAGVLDREPEDMPELPNHWVWVRLGSIATRMDSGWSPACNPGSAAKDKWGVLKTTAVQTLQYQEEQNKELPSNLEPRPEHEVMDGDILFTRAGPMNRVGILCVARPTRKRLMISDKIIRFHLVVGIDPDFAALTMNAGHSSVVVEGLKSGMAASQVNISQPKLRFVPIPIPPFAEQRRIVAKVNDLMALVDQLEAQQQERDKLAEAFAKACVASFTGYTQLERPKKMKAPKTELVSLVTLGKKPKPDAKAPLAELLSENKGTMPAKSLWQQSGLTIDAFYQQLKTEIAQGWIAPPVEAEMKILEEA